MHRTCARNRRQSNAHFSRSLMDFHATLSKEIDYVSPGERFAAKQLLSSLIYHRHSYRLAGYYAVIRLRESSSIHDLNFIFFQLHTPLSFRYENTRDWDIISALCITRQGWWRCENRRSMLGYSSEVSNARSTLAGGEFPRCDFIVSHRNFISQRRAREKSRIEREYEITNGKRVLRLFLFLPLRATFRVNREKPWVSS